MNFADILDEWDRRTPNKGIYIKDEETETESRESKHRRLQTKKPDAIIDLHGLTQEEAWINLEEFFNKSHSKGYEKVLVIHGKGQHSKNAGVLKELCRKFIERCPFAGISGRSHASMGGSGATWVMIKKPNVPGR